MSVKKIKVKQEGDTDKVKTKRKPDVNGVDKVVKKKVKLEDSDKKKVSLLISIMTSNLHLFH